MNFWWYFTNSPKIGWRFLGFTKLPWGDQSQSVPIQHLIQSEEQQHRKTSHRQVACNQNYHEDHEEEWEGNWMVSYFNHFISKFLNNNKYRKGHLRRRSKCAIHGRYWQPHMCQTHGCLIREGPWFLQVLSLFKADLIKQTGVAWSGVANILDVTKITLLQLYSHCLCFQDFGNTWNRFQWYFLSSHGRKVNNHPPKKKNDDVNTLFFHPFTSLEAKPQSAHSSFFGLFSGPWRDVQASTKICSRHTLKVWWKWHERDWTWFSEMISESQFKGLKV